MTSASERVQGSSPGGSDCEAVFPDHGWWCHVWRGDKYIERFRGIWWWCPKNVRCKIYNIIHVQAHCQ